MPAAANGAVWRLAGEEASKARATMANTGTVQNAQTHPLEADGFDKAILLMKTR